MIIEIKSAKETLLFEGGLEDLSMAVETAIQKDCATSADLICVNFKVTCWLKTNKIEIEVGPYITL